MADFGSILRNGTPERAIARVYSAPRQRRVKVNARVRRIFRDPGASARRRRRRWRPPTLQLSFSIIASVLGGGVRGQADAVKLGIARALMQFNAELRGTS